MDELKAFREIKKVAQLHYFSTDGSDKRTHFEKGVEYLSQCQAILYNYFKSNKELSGKIIYSTLSYIDHREKKQTHTALIANNDFKSGYYWNDNIPNFGNEEIAKADGFFKTFIGDINQNKLISLTNILFDRNKFKAPDFIISNCKIKKDDVYTLGSSVSYQEEPLCHFQYHKKKGVFYTQYKSSINSFIDVYNQEKVSVLNSDYFGKVKNYFIRYLQAIDLFNEFGLKNVNFNFIKPFLEGNEYNVLLTVAANDQLTNSERAVINLFLYKIVSYMASDLQTLKAENADLRRRKSFSLTTHSLKTHLNTTVVITKNAFNDTLTGYPLLKEEFKEHSREVDTLFHLTELLSLIDKIDNSEKFKKAATEVLFTDTKVSYNFKEHLDKFNQRHNTFPDLISIPTIEKFEFDLTIYELFFGEKLLELFFNTIFENLLAYGKPNKDCKKELRIDITENSWTFKNDTLNKVVSVDEEKLTGNLELYRKLINETKSGLFSINTGEFKFEIIIKRKNYE
jgi:transposase-like protein